MMDADDTTRHVLTAVRNTVVGFMPHGHPEATLPQVLSFTHARRRRRRIAGGSFGAAALAAGVATAVALATPGGAPSQGVTLAAWSVGADSNGTVTLDMRHFTDLAQLRQALAADHVPALVRRGLAQCSADTASSRNEIINVQPGSVPDASHPVALPGGAGTDWRMEVDPSLLPAGYELDISSGVYPPFKPGQSSDPQPGYPGSTQSGIVRISVIKQGSYSDCL